MKIQYIDIQSVPGGTINISYDNISYDNILDYIPAYIDFEYEYTCNFQIYGIMPSAFDNFLVPKYGKGMHKTIVYVYADKKDGIMALYRQYKCRLDELDYLLKELSKRLLSSEI